MYTEATEPPDTPACPVVWQGGDRAAPPYPDSAARWACDVPRGERRYPMADVTPDLIFQVANGFMAAKHLFVANEVGLFEALADSLATLDDLAQRTGIPRRT